MDTRLLHEAGGAFEVIPDSVRLLDAALNQRVRTATPGAQLDTVLREQRAIKRALAELPTAIIAPVAHAILHQLTAASEDSHAA